MSRYKRIYQPGAVYFFTVNLANRHSKLLTEEISSLKVSFLTVKARRPFKQLAWVILPDHMHLIWQLPEPDMDYSGRWRDIKTRFTKACRKKTILRDTSIWQPRFWEHTIRDSKDLINHINYIHYNPVKHGLATSAIQWPHSSFHTFLSKGYYSENWLPEGFSEKTSFGESSAG